MLESTSFTFNNISSTDMGVVLVNNGSGLYEEMFFPSRNIIETSISNRNAPYFKRVENSPLSFSISIWIKEWRELDNLRAIARWLFTDYYKPLYFDSNPERIFYVIFEGTSTLFHNGLKDGYITLNCRCNSPFSFSPMKTKSYDVNGSTSFYFYNEGDLPLRPKMKFYCRRAGTISVRNNQNGQEFKITGVQPNETIDVDCANEIIISSFEYINRYLYDSHNNIWLEIDAASSSQITLTGNFTLDWQYEYVYLYE